VRRGSKWLQEPRELMDKSAGPYGEIRFIMFQRTCAHSLRAWLRSHRRRPR